MMKKLLILMLVLGITSAASAVTISLDLTGSADHPAGSIEINVVSDATSDTPYEAYIAITDITYGDFSSVVALAGAGDAAVVTDFGAYDIYAHILQLVAKDVTEPFDSVVPGNQFLATVAFTGVAVGQDVSVHLLDATLTQVVDAYTIQGIPEPMTIALLGLGGLFLLRRRK